MADGTIKIDIEVDGKPVQVASKDLEKMEKVGRDSGKGIKKAEDSMDGLADSSKKASKDVKKAKDETKGAGDESNKASGKVKKFATALGLIAIGAAAFSALKASMDDAISRFDTLNKFPKVLQALGVSAEDSEKAMNKLSDGIDGLPTKLDEISSNAQRMYTSFNDMDKATDTALALNNALLGSGSSADEAQRGTEQYLQALQRGKFEMEEWKTLQETMDIGLIKVAESLGFAGKTAKQDLYQALKDNVITMDQFNDKLIEVGTGTGIMATLAKENSLGIATSLGNLKNAAARGMAGIIDSFNKLSKEVTGNDIAENIDGMKKIVNASFKAMQSVIEGTAPFVKAFADGVKVSMPVIEALTPALIGLASAYAIHKVINLTTKAIKASTVATGIATASKYAYEIATNRLTRAMNIALVQQKLQTAALLSYNKIVAIATTVQAMLTAGMSLASIATIAMSGAISILGTAIKVLLGPVGWVTLAIGALVGAVVGLVKWLNKETAEAKKLNAETEKLGDSTDELNDAVESTSKNYKKSQDEIKATTKANQDLAKRIEDLTNKENKSAAEKKLLNDYIEQLNGSVEDLNLSYNEEANALSMSSKELQTRIDLMGEQTSYNEALERQVEISKEQNEVEAKLAETNALREEWNQKLEEGSVKSKEHKKAIEELDEQEKLLNETTAQLAEQQKATEEQITLSMEAIVTATEDAINNQIIKFEELSESQQTTVENMKAAWEDYKAAATDMFDTLSDKSELSVQEMQANMEENQRIIGEWAENIAILAERGVDQGLLDTLREAGPESAGHVKALVEASDTELEKLSETFSKGGQTATDALSKSLGIEETGVMGAVGHLIKDTEQSLRQQVNNADFESIGTDVTDGFGGGIENGTPDVERASKDMAEKAVHSTEKALSINSPSKVFKEIGGHSTDGLALGINDGTAKVIATMKKLATSMLTPYNSTSSQFKSIGTNSMAGLNQGLLSGRAQVLSTARSIANSIAGTMQSALRIHSPSLIMKNKVGKWIPEGIAVGIKDNAKSVYAEIKKMSQGMIMTATPEQALGTSRMAYSSVGSQFVSALSGNNNTSAVSNETGVTKEKPAYINLVLGGREFRAFVKDITTTQERTKLTLEAFEG